MHQHLVEQGHLDLIHVQADEIRVKGRKMIAWMGLAMMISTRLWIAGVVQHSRDRNLADQLLRQVRRCAISVRPLLVLTDGWSAYPGSIQRAFREKIKRTAGVGRACLQVWPQLHIGTVIKRTQKKRVVEVTRRMAHGLLEPAEYLLQASSGGSILNTAFIERLNATFRQRLANLTRRSRQAARTLTTLETGMYLIGCTYNFCFPHRCPLEKQACWLSLYACYGRWSDRSYLEHWRTLELSHGSLTLDCTRQTRTTKESC